MDALKVNKEFNAQFLETGRYEVKNKDFLLDTTLRKGKFDLIVSSMVLEHFDDVMEKQFINRCATFMKKNGTLILFVPASERHWGIEDDIAGHFRRYTRKKIYDLANELNLKVNFISGLTYPLSNLLLPISNFLVKKHECNKTSLSNKEKTIQSGHRSVQGKTQFSKLFRIVLNEFFLFPMHIAQKIFKNNENCLVLYVELTHPL